MSDAAINVRIANIRDITEHVRLFELVPEVGERLPPFDAGAHVDVMIAENMVRQYSLLNAPGDQDRYVIAVAREAEGRGGSAHMHARLSPGDVLRVSAPRCHFPLVETAPHSVLVAGGIGITPIWCMIQRLEALGASWTLHYAARTWAQAPLIAEIEQGSATAAERVHTYFNLDGDPLMDLRAIVASAPEGTHFYCCGPLSLLEAYRAACASIPGERVHFEQFTAAAPAALDGGYEIELARSRKTVAVAPGESILDALKRAGLSASYSCREGVCGSCETAVLSGTPDHRDAILTDAERVEGRTMMICCSGSLSPRLVLDL
jgi:tetrachlorobenzoquinone reductase